MRSSLIFIGAALLIAGCSGGNNSSAAQPQTQATAATGGATQPSAVGAAPSEATPLYPGAQKVPYQMARAITVCGHDVNMVLYQVKGGDFTTVSNWYGDHMQNAVHIARNADLANGSGTNKTAEYFDASGAHGAFVSQSTFAGQMGAYMAAHGDAAVHIGLATYDPAFSPDELRMLQQAAGDDPTAKAQAAALMRAKCPDLMRGPATAR